MRRSSEEPGLSRRDFLKSGALAAMLGATALPAFAARTRLSAPSSKKKASILIVGGGAAGIDAAARLSRSAPNASITLVTPNAHHLYQSGLFFRALGIYDRNRIWRQNTRILHEGVKLLIDRVEEIDPEKRRVVTAKKGELAYDVLVVATGVEARFDLIDGLEDPGSWEESGIASLYRYDLARAEETGALSLGRWFDAVRRGRSPRVLVAEGEGPVKAENTPLDIFFQTLADMKEGGEATLAKASSRLVADDRFDRAITALARRKAGAKILRGHTLTGIDPANRTATFDTGEEVKEIAYDFLHVTPPFKAPECVAASPLAVQEGRWEGYLDCDPETLRHRRYPEVFGAGDVLARSPKSGGAARDHAIVLQDNIASWLDDAAFPARYTGYTVAPVKIAEKEMFAEYDRHGPSPTIPLDPTVPRRLYRWIDEKLMPWAYFELMMRGMM
jgi:sulfide:quinone oxidoreductase